MRLSVAAAARWTLSERAIYLAIMSTYAFLATKTGQLARDSGRSDNMWLLYGALIPGISLLHITLLRRRDTHEEVDARLRAREERRAKETIARRSARRYPSVFLMVPILLLVILGCVFMGFVAFTPGTDNSNRLIALFLFVLLAVGTFECSVLLHAAIVEKRASRAPGHDRPTS